MSITPDAPITEEDRAAAHHVQGGACYTEDYAHIGGHAMCCTRNAQLFANRARDAREAERAACEEALDAVGRDLCVGASISADAKLAEAMSWASRIYARFRDAIARRKGT